MIKKVNLLASSLKKLLIVGWLLSAMKNEKAILMVFVGFPQKEPIK